MQTNKFTAVLTVCFLFLSTISHASSPSATLKAEQQPSIGLGLNGISYWEPNFPFINLMKQAEGGAMHPVWGAPKHLKSIHYNALEEKKIIDHNGWPREIPENYFWSSIVSADAGYIPSQKGTYLLTYKGTGIVNLVTSGKTLHKGQNSIAFEITKDDQLFIQVKIEDTDLANNGDYVRDIVIVKDEHLELYQAGLLFNPQWLNLIKDKRVLRFMDWQYTNKSVEQYWNERPTLKTNTWGRTFEKKSQKGVPLEAMVSLANIAGIDPWFTLPFHADDEYIKQFAQYVKDTLDPRLTAYYEYSNEVWNWVFTQTHDARDKGLKTFGKKFGEYPHREYYGYRSAQMSHMIHKIYGPKQNNRVHVTLATQTIDNDYPLKTAIAGADFYAQKFGLKINELFKSAAVTWYFGVEPDLQAQIHDWINREGETRAISKMFEQLSGRHAHFKTKSRNHQPTLAKLIASIRAQATLAKTYGLDIISYEGGTHLVGYESHQNTLSDYFIKVNNDPRMALLYETIHQAWLKIPEATLLNHFLEMSSHSKFGSWGALKHLEDSSARWDFIERANKTPGNFAPRAFGTFDDGIISIGSASDESLIGSSEEDFLVGKAGNDTLKGNDGSDGLHGGQGNDKIYGGNGNDTLVGGPGQDELHGGKGKDRFTVTQLSAYVDTIKDFNVFEDSIDLSLLPLTGPNTHTFLLEKIDAGYSLKAINKKLPDRQYTVLNIETTSPLKIDDITLIF